MKKQIFIGFLILLTSYPLFYCIVLVGSLFFSKALFIIFLVVTIWRYKFCHEEYQIRNYQNGSVINQLLSKIFRSIMNTLITDYFHSDLHISEDSKNIINEINRKKQKIIFTSQPHGIFSVGSHCMIVGKEMEKQGLGNISIKKLAASFTFKLPGVKEMFKYISLIDASRKTAEKCLRSKDYHLMSAIGGVRESILNHKNPNIVFLKQRKGCVRLALNKRNKVRCLIPTYTFGENDLFWSFDFLTDFRLKFCRITGIPLFLILGKWFFPLVPKDKKIDVVVGKPILIKEKDKVDDGEKISQSSIEKYHKKFIKEVESLFNENVKKFGNKDAKLIVL